jgi:hypothetical protein
MQIVRAFWGDMNPRYTSQIIDSVDDKLNEIVYVWGKENYEFITSKGFMCILVSEEPYDSSISNAHHFYDYRNMHHKLVCIDTATKEFGEILFLDWDCRLIKDLDSNFYDKLKSGNSIQAPLYVYPKVCLDKLIIESNNDVMSKFFDVLELNLVKYSYIWNDCYVIPNTGFVYCRDSNITNQLCKISEELKLETLVEEFALYHYISKTYSLDDYITNVEPSLISGKSHGNVLWDKYQETFNKYVSLTKLKDVYFVHN